MKSVLLGCVAAMTLGMAAAAAQSTSPTPAATPATNAGATPTFVDKQDTGLLRAPKLVGVSVYDNNNKSVGKIDDLLVDKDGSVKTVVIGVGGFLGIGKKDVAVPYSAIHWQTEERTVAVNDAAPGAPAGGGTAAKPAEKKVDAAATETYQGYPDRAVIDVSQDQLKAAPEFKYASNPMNSASTKQ